MRGQRLISAVGWLPFAAMAQQYTAGAGQTVVIPDGSTASSATGSAISATGGGVIIGTDVSASSGDVGNGPVIFSSDAGSAVSLTGTNTRITANGTGVRMDNGGQVSLGGGTVININGSNSGSAGIVVSSTAVAAGTTGSGVAVNFNTAGPHTGNNAWIGVSLAGTSSASFDNMWVSSNSTTTGFAITGNSSLTLSNSAFTFNETLSGAYDNLWSIGMTVGGFGGGAGGYISGQNAVVNASNTSFNVSSLDGSGRWGLFLQSGTFNGDHVSFTVGGTVSRGMDMQEASRVNLVDSSVTMLDSGIGALVGENSVLTGTRTTFTALGTTGVGVQAQGGGGIFLTDSTVDARGAGGFGIRAGNSTGVVPGTATITVSGGTVMGAGTAIRATSSDSRLTLKDGVRVTGGNGILLDVTNTGVATLAADNAAVLNGDIQAAVQNSATVVLSNDTTWTGAARNIGATSVTSGSTWNMTGNSDIASLLHDSSTIAYATPAGDPTSAASYKTLTIRGNYTGNNGLISLNTFLGGDNSPTDRMIVHGDTAGSSFLHINNTGGLGALTIGDGIRVVEVQGNSAGTFTLANRVAAGLYEYTLYHGGAANPEDGNWYLRNVIVPPEPSPPEPTPPGPTPPEPTPPAPAPEPNIRAEIPLVTAIQPLAMEYGYTLLDTLHERVGEIWSDNRVRRSTRAWGRAIWNRGFQDNDIRDVSDFFDKGPRYDYSIDGIQLGADVYEAATTDGLLDQAGLYFGWGRVSADVDEVFGGKAGSIRMDGYSLGGYWTHKSPARWYSDAVVQGTMYSTDAHSVPGEHIKPDGWGFLASLEGGYGFSLDNGFILEPQAQLVYQTISFDNARDSFGAFEFDDSDSLRGRIGARLGKIWRTDAKEAEPRMVSAWLRGNVWHEFIGDSQTRVTTLDGGGDAASITAPLKGTWGEIGVGITGQVTKSTSLFATGSYSHSFDDGGREAWGARLGASVRF